MGDGREAYIYFVRAHGGSGKSHIFIQSLVEEGFLIIKNFFVVRFWTITHGLTQR
jgi:hypothetical protein